MKNNLRVSVALAVYNGEKYLREQIDSILAELGEHDELVVSYDQSSDGSLQILRDYESKDKRVRILIHKSYMKHIGNFQNAIEHCQGDIIFLSDQDDVWVNGKVAKVLKEFEDPRVACVVHDSFHTDADLKVICPSTFAMRGGARDTFWGNLYRLCFIGCCMAFRSAYKAVILPIPQGLSGHDWWIGSILSVGKSYLRVVQYPLIYHRQHDGNTTPKSRPGIGWQMKERFIILWNVVRRYNKKLKQDKLVFNGKIF